MSQTKTSFLWQCGELHYNPLFDDEVLVVSYYQTGQLKFQCPVQKGSLAGLCTTWYENGNKKRQGAYLRGRLQGIERSWHENGMLETEGSYRSGLAHGIFKEWNENGILVNKEIKLINQTVPEIFKALLTTNTLTAKHIISNTNVEIRRILLDDFGYERFLQQLDHEIIHRDGEQELVRIVLPELKNEFPFPEEPIVLVKVKCPTTGAYYTLRVPPTMVNVKEAVAWTFGLKENEYSPQAET